MAEGKKAVKRYVAGEKYCPKCSSRLAVHSDRYTCGRCGYTEWKSK